MRLVLRQHAAPNAPGADYYADGTRRCPELCQKALIESRCTRGGTWPFSHGVPPCSMGLRDGNKVERALCYSVAHRGHCAERVIPKRQWVRQPPDPPPAEPAGQLALGDTTSTAQWLNSRNAFAAGCRLPRLSSKPRDLPGWATTCARIRVYGCCTGTELPWALPWASASASFPYPFKCPLRCWPLLRSGQTLRLQPPQPGSPTRSRWRQSGHSRRFWAPLSCLRASRVHHPRRWTTGIGLHRRHGLRRFGNR